MVFVFWNAVCRHSVATTQFTSHCIAFSHCQFVPSRNVRCSRHIQKQQILFHRQFEDKQEFEKETNKSFIVHISSFHGSSTHHSTVCVCAVWDILFASVLFFFLIHFKFHFYCLRISSVCLCSWFLFQVLFVVLCAFPFCFWQKVIQTIVSVDTQ